KSRDNARKHDLYTARRALNEFGLRAIDGRSELGVAIRQFRASIVRDLGGEAAISAQRRAVLDIAIRTKLMVDSIDVYILSRPSLVDRKKRALLPIVRERAALANAFVEHMRVLGLERVPPPALTLQDVLRSNSSNSKASATSQQPTANVQRDQSPAPK